MKTTFKNFVVLSLIAFLLPFSALAATTGTGASQKSSAPAGYSLKLKTPKEKANPGETIMVSLQADSTGQEVLGLKAYVLFDTAFFEPLKITNLNKNVDLWAEKNISEDKKSVKFTGGISKGHVFAPGEEIAQIQFRIKKNTENHTEVMQVRKDRSAMKKNDKLLTDILKKSEKLSIRVVKKTAVVPKKTTSPKKTTKQPTTGTGKKTNEKTKNLKEAAPAPDAKKSDSSEKVPEETTSTGSTITQILVITVTVIIFSFIISIYALKKRKESAENEEIESEDGMSQMDDIEGVSTESYGEESQELQANEEVAEDGSSDIEGGSGGSDLSDLGKILEEEEVKEKLLEEAKELEEKGQNDTAFESEEISEGEQEAKILETPVDSEESGEGNTEIADEVNDLGKLFEDEASTDAPSAEIKTEEAGSQNELSVEEPEAIDTVKDEGVFVSPVVLEGVNEKEEETDALQMENEGAGMGYPEVPSSDELSPESSNELDDLTKILEDEEQKEKSILEQVEGEEEKGAEGESDERKDV